MDNKVYNITNFIPKHEGGDVIVNMCGIDGTDMFNNQHRGQSKPARILMKLVMGLYEK
ncbi:MAG: cytochrome b5 domain-containing protein [Cyanobium sp. MAG06]|nr:cytochrome b5 domain-containing protein [Cyanobium sp. MAG06]